MPSFTIRMRAFQAHVATHEAQENNSIVKISQE